MSKYLLGCLSTLFISCTVGVISFPKFSGKFRLFISSQMFANLLNIHKICNTPKQTGSPANHRLLTERLILTLSVSMQYDIILMSPSQRGTPQSFTNDCECNKPHAANTFFQSIFSHLPPVVSSHTVYCPGFCFLVAFTNSFYLEFLVHLEFNEFRASICSQKQQK